MNMQRAASAASAHTGTDGVGSAATAGVLGPVTTSDAEVVVNNSGAFGD